MRLLLCIILGFLATFAIGAGVAGDDPPLILQNTNVIDVVSGRLQRRVDIRIEAGIIRSILPHNPEKTGSCSQVIDASGLYCLPGLIDAHTHVSNLPERSLTIALKKGVTAIRDMGGDGRYLRELQQALIREEFPGPDIYFSALMGGKELIRNDTRVRLSTPEDIPLGEAPWARQVTKESRIKQVIDSAAACGAAGIKIYSHLDAALVTELAREAKAQGLKVWAHGVVYPATLEEVVNAGTEAVSHASSLLLKQDWDPKREGSLAIDTSPGQFQRLDGILDSMAARGTFLDPTFTVMKYMTRSLQDREKARKLEEALYKAVRAAHTKGIRIVAGTDSPLPASENDRLPLWDEIKTLVYNVRMRPIEAIRAATLNSAHMLGIETTHGSLQEGKAADILVLKANPLVCIEELERVAFVIKKGRIQ